MAELAHEQPSYHHADCLVCRAKAQAPRRLLQGLALFAAGLCITTGVLDLRPATHARAHRVAALPAQGAAPSKAPAKATSKPAPPVVVRKPAAVSTAVLDSASATLTK